MPLLVLAVLAFLVVLGRCGSDGPGGRSRLIGGLHIVNVVAVVVAMFSDYWEVAHDATPLGFFVVVVGLIGFAAAFVASRAQASLAGLSTFDSWHEIHQLLRRRPSRTYGSRRRHRSRPI